MAKILLVESHWHSRQVLYHALRRQNHIVECVYSVPEVLELLSAFEFDLVIMSINVKGGSPLDICKHLRQGAAGYTPLIVIATMENSQCKVSMLRSGVDEFLLAPIDPEELCLRVRSLVRRLKVVPTELEVTVGNLLLKPEQRTVLVNGTVINLAPKEYAILEFLMRNPDRIFSSEAIHNRVWMSSSSVTSDAVATCLRRMRKKIDVDPERQLIVTVHGGGYMLKSG